MPTPLLAAHPPPTPLTRLPAAASSASFSWVPSAARELCQISGRRVGKSPLFDSPPAPPQRGGGQSRPVARGAPWTARLGWPSKPRAGALHVAPHRRPAIGQTDRSLFPFFWLLLGGGGRVSPPPPLPPPPIPLPFSSAASLQPTAFAKEHGGALPPCRAHRLLRCSRGAGLKSLFRAARTYATSGCPPPLRTPPDGHSPLK